MVIVKPDGKRYYMSNLLKQNLDILKHEIKNDWDFMILISGSGIPGVGKSVLAGQIAKYLDPTFSLDDFMMDGKKFVEQGAKYGKQKKIGKAIVYDEARRGLDAKKWSYSVQKALLDYFAECRQYNLFLIIVLPDFFELKKEVALNRSVFMINVYTNGFTRGFYSFYSRPRKKQLYLKGKEWLNYHAAKPDFRDKFTKYYVVNEEGYRKKKLTEVIRLNKLDEKATKSPIGVREKKVMEARNKAIKRLLKELKPAPTQRQVAEWLGMTPKTITSIVNYT